MDLKLQICNICLIVFGMAAIGSLAVQFYGISMNNYHQIDLRPLFYFHIINGVSGLFFTLRRHEIALLKTLYAVSLAISCSAIIFYGWIAAKTLLLREHIPIYTQSPNFLNPVTLQMNYSFQNVIIYCMLSIIGLITALSSLLALIFLKQIHIEKNIYKLNSNRGRSIMISIVKLFLALFAFIIACFVEYEHQTIPRRSDYIKISLDLITIILVVVTSIFELYAYSQKKISTLDRKVCFGLSIFSAVWCIKLIDNNMFPHFWNDINFYRTAISLTKIALPPYPTTSQQALSLFAEGTITGIMVIIFLLSMAGITTALYAWDKSTKSLLGQEKWSSGLFFVFSLVLMVLVFIGFGNFSWNGDFIGGDLLWIVVLFLTTSILIFSPSNEKMKHVKFVMSMICCSIAVEKFLASINLVYQSAFHSSYANINVTDRRTFIAQIILYSIQTILFFLAFTMSLFVCYLCQQDFTFYTRKDFPLKAIHLLSSIGSLIYGITFTICYIFFEFGKWRFLGAPLEEQFYRIGNGPFALSVFFVQILVHFRPKLILSSAIAQMTLSVLALFMICPTTMNIFYLFVQYTARKNIDFDSSEKLVFVLEIILTIIAALSCIICTICVFINLMSYPLEEKSKKESGIYMLKLNESPPIDSQPLVNTEETSSLNISTHQILIQPIEEQTLYWSSDENPYIYKSTKRIYYADSEYQSTYASPTTNVLNDENGGLISTLEKPPRKGGNSVISKTKIAYSTKSDYDLQ